MASKSETVYRELRSLIVGGALEPGSRLVLARIADERGVSPVPVREALRRLEAEGLVEFRRNVGAQVAGVDHAGYADTMRVLAVLEGAATGGAVGHLGAAELARARGCNDEMRRVRGERPFDAVRFTQLNHDFHTTLAGACPNRRLVDLLEREWDELRRVSSSSFLVVPDRSDESVEEHERLLELLERGAPAAEVERAAREHKLRTLAAFLAAAEGAVDPARA